MSVTRWFIARSARGPAGDEARSLQDHPGRYDLLFSLKAGPEGGCLRRPSSRRQRHDGAREAGPTLRAS
jgi:hypothetical protein